MLTVTESTHPLVIALDKLSDQELIALMQTQPNQGKYFAAIYSRYAQTVYALTQFSDYQYALVWQQAFRKLKTSSPNTSVKSLLVDLLATSPNLEAARPFDLALLSPVYWCYVDAALGMLPKHLRLVLVLSHGFSWSNNRIATYLRAEGEIMSDIQSLVFEASAAIATLIPTDLQQIYPDLSTLSNLPLDLESELQKYKAANWYLQNPELDEEFQNPELDEEFQNLALPPAPTSAESSILSTPLGIAFMVILLVASAAVGYLIVDPSILRDLITPQNPAQPQGTIAPPRHT